MKLGLFSRLRYEYDAKEHLTILYRDEQLLALPVTVLANAFELNVGLITSSF